MNNDTNNETNPEVSEDIEETTETAVSSEEVNEDIPENTENTESENEEYDDDDDDFGASIDIPLPTQDELESINDVELPQFSEEPQKKEKKPILKSKAFRAVLIAVAAIIAIVIIVFVACIVTLPVDTISKNVYIENLNVGGLTYDEALSQIEQSYIFENQQITLSCNGQSYTLDGLSIGLAARPEETAQKAFDYGKTGNKLQDGITAVGLLFHNHKIVPIGNADTEMLNEQLNEFGVQVYGERKNHSIEIGDGKAIIYPGTTGYDGNPETACAEVLDAIANESCSNIHVSLASAPPDELTLEEFDQFVYQDPIDAYYTVENNKVNIVEAETGRYINKEEAEPLLQNVVEGGDPVEIPYYIAYPSVTSEELQSKLFSDTMASYSTSFASSTASRASNVARAASLINGTVLAPGDVFSFNTVVGKRTVENGFSTAPEYLNGKTVQGIGGGTCQVSSTLYNAVLYSDLEVVSRTNHMFTVSYVPNGQDATVADSGPDFQFRNNTSYPIKVSAYTSGGQITVAIIGTAWSPKHEVKMDNVTSYGSNGETNVKTTRTVTVNGEVIKTESMPSSSYKKHDESQ
jgi:vancomycin resistance protein YoaR